jgi:hypothetical protein
LNSTAHRARGAVVQAICAVGNSRENESSCCFSRAHQPSVSSWEWSGIRGKLDRAAAPGLLWMAVVGFLLALAGFIVLRVWRLAQRPDPHNDDHDPRKLYGRSKA